MRLFSYVVRYDFGFAPNPFEGWCTVATCKPDIRRAAKVGDWVVGTGSAQRMSAGKLVYAMRVEEILTFDDYWTDTRFRRKIPTDRGPVKRAYGDNIYHHADDGSWLQADSRHSLSGGVPNPGHIAIDTSVNAVLIASHFTYYGGEGIDVPPHLRHDFGVDLVHSGRGHRCRFPSELVAAAVTWLNRLDRGMLGRPADWKRPTSP
ncbi:hypothetical protein BH09ACT8_BH09ACT8_19510 [soil metagenome]